METYSFETSADFPQTPLRYIPEGRTLHFLTLLEALAALDCDTTRNREQPVQATDLQALILTHVC
jgi:hypothetical protein